MAITIGVDIGGTKIAAGVVEDDGRLLALADRATAPSHAEAVQKTVIHIVNELAGQYPIEAVGIGVAGLIDQTRSRVLFSANLGWVDVPFGWEPPRGL